MNLQKKEKKGILGALLSILFIDNLALSIAYPLFTSLVLTPNSPFLPSGFSLSNRLLLLGLLNASFPFAQFLGGPMIGHLADFKGRKPTFFAALIGETIGFGLSALAMRDMNYPLLIFSRFLTGFFAGNLLLCLTAISDLSEKEEERNKNFGLIATCTGGGFVTAILIGGILSNLFDNPFLSSPFPFYFSALLCLGNVGILWHFYKETKRENPCPIHGVKNLCETIITALKEKNLRTLYGVLFFFMLGWIMILQFLPTLLVENFSQTKKFITMTFIATGILWCASSLWINRLFARFFRLQSVLLLSLIISTLSLFALSQSHSLSLFLSLLFIATFFAALIWTNTLSLIGKQASLTLRGRVFGITQSVATLSIAFSPLFGSFMGSYDLWTIYIGASIASLLATLLILMNLSQ